MKKRPVLALLSMIFVLSADAQAGLQRIKAKTTFLQLKSANLRFIPDKPYLSSVGGDQKLSEACTLTFDNLSSSILLSKDKKAGYYTTVESTGTELKLHFFIIESGIFTKANLACRGPHQNFEQVNAFLKNIGSLWTRK